MDFRDEIDTLHNGAGSVLEEKRDEYGDSWKKRGGIGSFMMLARKWDRIEYAVKQQGWDVFEAIRLARGNLLDDIRDLRNYLTLVEHEVTYGRRDGDSETDFAPDSQESPGAAPEQLGVGDNGDTQRPERSSVGSFRFEPVGRIFDKA